MLGLREHVRRDPAHIGRRIGQDQHFAGTGDHVDAHCALNQTLGRGHINIARSGDDVRWRQTLRAVGQGRDAPGPAHAVDFVDIQQMGGSQNVRVNAAVLAGRRADGQTRHARHLGRNGVHQQAGNQGRVAALAAWHVQAHGVHGQNPLAQDAAVRPGQKPGFLQLGFVESADVGGGPADLLPAFHGNRRRGAGDFLFAYAQGRGEIRAVETAGKVNKGFVALVPHGGQNVPHGIFNPVTGVAAALQPLGGFGPFLFVLQGQNTACHRQVLSAIGTIYRRAARMSRRMLGIACWRSGWPYNRAFFLPQIQKKDTQMKVSGRELS